MTPFEYILPLVSVLVGLAVADLAVSLHRLLRARSRVGWDWLPLATGLLAVLLALEFWWRFYSAQDRPLFATLGGFLLLAIQLVLLFLLNAAALPDEVPEEGLDLHAFYRQNASYFWVLYAAYTLFSTIVRLIEFLQNNLFRQQFGQALGGLIPMVLMIALFLYMAWRPRRTLHAIVTLVLVVLLLVEWWGLRLG
ncbi:MAG: hypothetical protein R2834_22145 [Rhodothermales bacterium]